MAKYQQVVHIFVSSHYLFIPAFYRHRPLRRSRLAVNIQFWNLYKKLATVSAV